MRSCQWMERGASADVCSGICVGCAMARSIEVAEVWSPAQHTSASVSIRQHTSAYVSIRQHTSAYVSLRQHTSAYVSIRQHPSACVQAYTYGPHAICLKCTNVCVFIQCVLVITYVCTCNYIQARASISKAAVSGPSAIQAARTSESRLLLAYCCFTAVLLRWPSGAHLIATGKRCAREHRETKVVALVVEQSASVVLVFFRLLV